MVALVVVLAGAGYAAATRAGLLHDRPLAERQREVAARGAQVMPFDLDKTTHVFDEAPDGGRQTVTADTAGDADQIALIRRHLREEQAAFARGDFSDPAAIHGPGMPGLAALRAGSDRVSVTYADLPDGAMLTYTTTDGVLVEALHAWFRAQLSDHGPHAEAGH